MFTFLILCLAHAPRSRADLFPNLRAFMASHADEIDIRCPSLLERSPIRTAIFRAGGFTAAEIESSRISKVAFRRLYWPGLWRTGFLLEGPNRSLALYVKRGSGMTRVDPRRRYVIKDSEIYSRYGGSVVSTDGGPRLIGRGGVWFEIPKVGIDGRLDEKVDRSVREFAAAYPGALEDLLVRLTTSIYDESILARSVVTKDDVGRTGKMTLNIAKPWFYEFTQTHGRYTFDPARRAWE